MKIVIVHTWEEVRFVANSKNQHEVVEVSFNNETNCYNITTPSEESVNINDLTLKRLELRTSALEEAIKYVKHKLKGN